MFVWLLLRQVLYMLWIGRPISYGATAHLSGLLCGLLYGAYLRTRPATARRLEKWKQGIEYMHKIKQQQQQQQTQQTITWPLGTVRFRAHRRTGAAIHCLQHVALAACSHLSCVCVRVCSLLCVRPPDQ